MVPPRLALLYCFSSALTLASAGQSPVGTPIDGTEAESHFGWAVALSADGQRLAVGAFEESGSGEEAGAVSVYARNGSQYEQLGNTLPGDTIGARCRRSVALSADGNRLAVGCDGYGTPGRSGRGRVRVYDFDGTDWSAAGGPIDGDVESASYGFRLALSSDGSHLVTGQPTRVFTRDGSASTWRSVGAPLARPADATFFSIIAPAISADGSVVVLADYLDQRGVDERGAFGGGVLTYERRGDGYVLVDDMTNTFAEGLLGISVDMTPDARALVVGVEENGAISQTAPSGLVAFSRDGDGWAPVAVELPRDDVRWGGSVAIADDGSRVVSGAVGEIVREGTRTGSPNQAYQLSGGGYVPLGEPLWGDGADLGGAAVALSGDGRYAAIGAPLYDLRVDARGRVRVWDLRGATVSRVIGTRQSAGVLEVFPNPTTGTVRIAKLPRGLQRATLTDLAGRHVLAEKEVLAGLHAGALELERLSTGLYVLTAYGREATSRVRVLVE